MKCINAYNKYALITICKKKIAREIHTYTYAYIHSNVIHNDSN